MSGGRRSPGSLRSRLDQRGAVAVVVALLLAGTVLLLRANGTSGCPPEPRVAAGDVPPVFDTGADPDGSDARLGRLVAAARSWGLGPVVGALGFDYGHYLSLAALPDGLAAWTHGSPDVALLDNALRPRWAIAQDRGEHAWDLTADGWLQLRLPAHAPMQVTDRALADGSLRWCTSVGSRPTRYGDPLATATLPDGDVLALAAARPGGVLERLGAGSGAPRWSRRLVGAHDGSALLALGPLVLTGGRASYDLAGGARDQVAALDPATGRTVWRWRADGPAHVLGSSGDLVLLEELRGGRLDVVALDRAGRERWRRPAPAGALPDGTVRADTLVLRTPGVLMGWSATTGQVRWRRTVPAQPQYLPYGFQLDAQPMLDADHLLLGGTQALVSLDLRTGGRISYPLPVHGIDTTYWPYQVLVTDHLLAVVTNTGAVVVRR